MLITVFIITGLAVFAYKGQVRYFFLFAGIGCATSAGEWLCILFFKNRQVIRRTTQAVVGGTLFIFLSLYGNVNFQFMQITFDFLAGVVTGALIQFIIARLFLPFFIGNGFCSRACWDGAIFELIQDTIPKVKKAHKRSNRIAWSYFFGLILIASIVASYCNPANMEHEPLKRFWNIGENIIIMSIGIGLSRFWGSRTYCRTFCPFISVSGLLSRFSIFKITPVQPQKCTCCGKCNLACPMLVDVRSFVKAEKRITDKSCIVCEHCVDACPEECISLSPDMPWK